MVSCCSIKCQRTGKGLHKGSTRVPERRGKKCICWGYRHSGTLRTWFYSNIIVNCLVTFDDVKNAKLIFGPDITSLKGKSARRKADIVVMDYFEIPREIPESPKEIEVSMDIMFINKIPFLAIIILGLKFTTI